VDEYNSNEGVLDFWQTIYASREGMTIFPTTTMPSAHVVWVVFSIYVVL